MGASSRCSSGVHDALPVVMEDSTSNGFLLPFVEGATLTDGCSCAAALRCNDPNLAASEGVDSDGSGGGSVAEGGGDVEGGRWLPVANFLTIRLVLEGPWNTGSASA
jgi:hypothetical protein